MATERPDIPLIIGGKEMRSGELSQAVMPHDHSHVLADWHKASPKHVAQAIEAAEGAHPAWSAMAWEDRAAVFLKAADLLSTRWRATLNAATMLNQSKTAYQAEIDSACELIDFWRWNAWFAGEIYGEQPVGNNAVWNQMDYRALEGFVYAVTPFNFTAIAGNLPSAPALMGNTVVWKPASSAILSGWYVMQLLQEAGLPPGVINFVPGDAGAITDDILKHRALAGVHFTGSTSHAERLGGSRNRIIAPKSPAGRWPLAVPRQRSPPNRRRLPRHPGSNALGAIRSLERASDLPARFRGPSRHRLVANSRRPGPPMPVHGTAYARVFSPTRSP
jgi:1-pyrroline-5-carboxylate dehydrogenase